MNATILPGPGTKVRPPSPRGGDRHNIQSVDRALFLLETIARRPGSSPRPASPGSLSAAASAT